MENKRPDNLIKGKFDKLIKRLKEKPKTVEYSDIPMINSDMLRLIELTGMKSKNDAIRFAVDYTLNNYGIKDHTDKLEKLRYAKV